GARGAEPGRAGGRAAVCAEGGAMDMPWAENSRHGMKWTPAEKELPKHSGYFAVVGDQFQRPSVAYFDFDAATWGSMPPFEASEWLVSAVVEAGRCALKERLGSLPNALREKLSEIDIDEELPVEAEQLAFLELDDGYD